MSQSGLRHAATEPDHLDAGRERTRRGGGGRAAVLRRAPSDSDCSAETASLSADSADRVRPQLVPIRTTKNRSRRRGSEWEVLEGLKDGQRFERRPEVFNGYLHKKRKWPLKGWHKRFFVIDGGILVYARSPSDVARGRLHGSVDVGLSVISAKARRRRIDIDADEFIYHLRAKTADVFRTWLNVLKVHRLYRQHLLTFGAREALPKIHAPLDDPPPAGASTSTPSPSSTLLSSGSQHSIVFLKNLSIPSAPPVNAYFHTLSYHTPVYEWTANLPDNDDLIPLAFENLEENYVKPELCNRSLCSMNCLERMYKREIMEMLQNRNKPESVGASIAEQQIHTTELERNSFKVDPYIESPIFNYSSPVSKKRAIQRTTTKDRPINPVFPIFSDNDEVLTKKEKKIKVKKPKEKSSLFRKKHEPTATYFLFSHKKNRQISPVSLMKRSDKCTNLVKYRNCSEEPPLDKPFSVHMLLKKDRTSYYSSNEIHKVETGSGNGLIKVDRSSGDELITINQEVQASPDNVTNIHKSLQDTMTSSEYDKTIEQLVISIFGQNKLQNHNSCNIKCYVSQMVKELYQIKIDQTDHPVKILFKSLLEYWLKNSSSKNIKSATKILTRDENQSGLFVPNMTKETQTQKPNSNDTKDVVNALNVASNNIQVTLSYMKERQIQELETLLKNTVYTYESAYSNQNKIKDIKITKRLIDSLESGIPKKTVGQCNVCMQPRDTSNTSTEYTEIKENVHHMISEISIPPECLKEFLEAYLKVLKDDSDVTQLTGDSKYLEKPFCCDVQTESMQRNVSVGVYAVIENKTDNNNDKDTKAKPQLVDTGHDSGQYYLKDVIDKVTTIYAKQNLSISSEDKFVQPDDTKAEGPVKQSLKDESNWKLENKDEHSVVIDLTKYDLEHISMNSDPTLNGTVSITLKLKERALDSPEFRQKNVNLIFSEEYTKLSPLKKNNLCPSPNRTTKNYCRPKMDPRISFKNPYIHYDPSDNIDKKDLKYFMCGSDATSKAIRVMYENENSHDLRTSESPDDRQHCTVTKRSPRSSRVKPKKKCRTASRNQSVMSLNQQQEKYDKPVGPIDENFIILLLENVTLLSQNLPGLYKDINVFYLKLKRRQEKKRNTGVGLLGKIYNESNQNTEERDEERQSDVACACYSQNLQSNEIGINLNDLTTGRRMHKGTSVTAVRLKETSAQCDRVTHLNTTTVNLAVSTSSNPFSVKHADIGSSKNKTADVAISTPNMFEKMTKADEMTDVALSSPKWLRKVTKAVRTTDVALSSSNWFQKMTRDCAMTTAIRSILNPESSCANFRFVNDIDMDKRTAQICQDRSEARSQQSEVKQILKSPNKITIESKTKRKSVEIDLKSMVSNKSSLEDLRRRRTKPSNCVYIQMTHQDDMVHKDNRRAKYYRAYPMFTDTRFNTSRVSNVSSRELGFVSDDIKTIYRCSSSEPSFVSGLVSPTCAPLRAQAGFVAGTPGGRLANWIVESGGPLEVANRELGQAHLSVQQLQRLLDAIELSQHHHDTDQASLEGASPSVKKDRRKFGLRKKKSSSKCASVELSADAAASHTTLSALTAPPSPCSAPSSAASLPIACAAARPQSLPGAEALGTSIGGPASLASSTPDQQLREDFTVLAKDLVTTLKGVVSTLVCERGRLRAAMDTEAPGAGGAALAALRTNLTSALQQNSELRSRLSRIHDASDLLDISPLNMDAVNRQFQASLSYSSSCVSASEFFDAEEHDPPQPAHDLIPADEAGVIELDGDSSSEAGSLSSEEGDGASAGSSDNSDGAMLEAEPGTLNQNGADSPHWRRRSRLPCPRPTPGGPSLWNLLYKNIGKDLSQVSMPVTINEPLNMLQRLCEELEYCELLDLAADCDSPLERMALVAAFAVSAYAATAHRAASKPFNPLLGESYECQRNDKGFKFLAEQVSHHPPISACHAEGTRWEFWQEARIKTKFWGKSMEFQPAGQVHVRLRPRGDHYCWNKVTTCVHNLFGGQRWVDQYGDMHISCRAAPVAAKLQFIKASSWSSSRHEVRGVITDRQSGQSLILAGRWSEALYAGETSAQRLLWRPGAMPPEHELYYGFTRFAMELNELEPAHRERLPPTDTRLRPDQRALELGDVAAAERHKLALEQAQRERRRDLPPHAHQPAWFRKVMEDGEEMWVFTGEYWRARETGFSGVSLPRIWGPAP